MKQLFWLLLLSVQFGSAQKLKKADQLILSNLTKHITYLSDDLLEGRRTGTRGEKLAYEYISKEFEKAGLVAKGENETWLQAFEVNDGKELNSSSHFIINGNDLIINQDYFPFSISPDLSLETTASVALQENASPWFYDIKELIEGKKSNPHADLMEEVISKATDAAKKGANAFFIFNSNSINDELKFEPRAKSGSVNIPIIYITKSATKKYLADETALLDIKLKIAIDNKKRIGHNVIGYINNNALTTIVIGAHYDHLGYGEDHNSLFTGSIPQIHNGADDNASGTGALIELSKLLKGSKKFKNNNYIVIAFSGEELGLFGSKYFTEHPTVDFSKINYMINMDMIGRLKDSTRGLSIGGYGTSPEWGNLLTQKDKYFKLTMDSSGTGPSDHSSFYRKGIPVLFFFTGTHSDYHKPSDDADKINFAGELQIVKLIQSLIEKADPKGQLAFTKTREIPMSAKSSFRVTLGIMPDYTYSGEGIRADGVTDGKIAQKAGMKAGDIILQIGNYTFSDMQSYMETLNKFSKGDAARVRVKRSATELVFDIVF
jgi:aminopeptidase YwaD